MFVALAMATSTMAFAQQGPYNDKQNPNEYTDTEDGQLLKVISYFLAPIGYALEWGVTRPLHYLATKTALAPAMSGDTEYSEMYNPGPNAEPIIVAPVNTVSATSASESTAPKTYIERTPVGPVVVPPTLAPLTSPPAQPVLH
ncbi:MAG TPA: hypothetical protein VNE82_08315 [Candidatus Binataceae bacterium]|nr:hypothetical protein [Candidatus Binataceae bacterium]